MYQQYRFLIWNSTLLHLGIHIHSKARNMKLVYMIPLAMAVLPAFVASSTGGYADSCRVITVSSSPGQTFAVGMFAHATNFQLYTGQNHDQPYQIHANCAGPLGPGSDIGWMCTLLVR